MISLYSTLFDLVNAENALSKTCRNTNKGDVNKGNEGDVSKRNEGDVNKLIWMYRIYFRRSIMIKERK